MVRPADWELPIGVDRGAWDYMHSDEPARTYDSRLADSPLLRFDIACCDRWFPTPGRLVDLGCGTGRLLLHAAQRGFECVGVDLSEGMLREVRRKADAVGVRIETHQRNLADRLPFADESFEYAACLFSTLGMLRGRTARQNLLRETFRIVRRGGVFVVHAHNREFALQRRTNLRWWLGSLFRGGEFGDRTMPQAYGGAPLTLHHFSLRELRRAVSACGFVELATVTLNADGSAPLARSWFLGRFRAYGWLLAVRKPG